MNSLRIDETCANARPWRILNGMRLLTILLTTGLASVAVAQDQAAKGSARNATAELKNAKGEVVGTVRAQAMRGGNGIRLTGNLSNLPSGEHGFHIHSVGKCDAPEFTTAGPHFNPGNHKHSLASQGGHEGDLGNIKVDDKGKAKVNATVSGVVMTDGAPNSLFKDGGTALMVHATADDLKTDPAGNAGARIACGVFTK